MAREISSRRSRLDSEPNRVTHVETLHGKRRRALLTRLAAPIGGKEVSEEGWRFREVDPKSPGLIFEHTDGRRMTMQLSPLTSEGSAKTTLFSLRQTGCHVEPPDMRFFARMAERVAQSESLLINEPGFPSILTDRRATTLALYVGSHHVELRPTLACNHHCNFCNSVDYTVLNLTQGMQDLLDTVPQLEPLAVRRVVISGGEPTLLPGLPKAIAAFADRGFMVELQTNGMAFDDPAYVTSMKAAGLTRAFVSLHSEEASISDGQITQFPGGWQRTTKGIDNALWAGIDVQISHVIHVANAEGAERFLRFVKQRWGRRVLVSIAFVTPTGSAAQELRAVIPPMTQVLPSLMSALDYGQAEGMPVQMQSFCGVPPCLLGDHQSASETGKLPETRYSDDHMKLPACVGCVYESSCPGLWKGYYTAHGDPGIKAIRSRDPIGRLKFLVRSGLVSLRLR